MTVRIALAVEAEFLRLVLRQLLRRMVGVEVVGETMSLQPGALSAAANLFIVDPGMAEADPPGFAALSARYPGRVVLLCHDAGRAPPGVVRLGIGLRPDPAVLAASLRAAIPRWANAAGTPTAEAIGAPAAAAPEVRTRRPELVVIAASTGGPEALHMLFAALQKPPCPVVIALHIPAGHDDGLAHHLAQATGHAIFVGQPGPLDAGGAVLLPGGMDHGVVQRDGGLWLRRVHGTPSVFHPNADVLLSSAAALRCHVAGVVLTGMGDDGRAGAAALAARGCPVLVQSPASCAVPGMPGACIAARIAHLVAPPAELAARLNAWFTLRSEG